MPKEDFLSLFQKGDNSIIKGATNMQNIKSVEDLFSYNLNVYHIFPTSKMDDILKDGLLCSKSGCSKLSEKKGTYVVWYNDRRVLSDVAEAKVSVLADGSPAGPLSLLTINLKKYGLSPKDIAPDFNDNGEVSVHSFYCKIVRDIFNIDPSDIQPFVNGGFDLYGMEFYDLVDYDICNKPKDYDFVRQYYSEYPSYRDIVWKDYSFNKTISNIN